MTLAEATQHAATTYDVVDSRPLAAWAKAVIADEASMRFPAWSLIAELGAATVRMLDGYPGELLAVAALYELDGAAEAYAASQGLN